MFNISFQTPHFLKLPRPMWFCQKALGSHSLICLVGRQIAHCCLSFEITTQQLSSLLRIILMTQTSAPSLRMRVMSERFRNVDSTSHFVFSVRSKLHWDRNEQILQSKRKETLPRTPRCLGLSLRIGAVTDKLSWTDFFGGVIRTSAQDCGYAILAFQWPMHRVGFLN